MTATQTSVRPDVKHLRDLGFVTFPCKGKRPRVKWQDNEPADGWTFTPDDNIGVRLPAGTVAADIDDLEEVRELPLEWVKTPGQRTQSGGFHFLYRTEAGRVVPQLVKRDGAPLDTRVGGKGYVIAWQAEEWVAVSEWAMAPEWLYTAPDRPAKAPIDPDAPMGTRVEITSYLGTLAQKNGPLLSEEAYLAILRSDQASGRIVALDPKRPWSDADLVTLAHEAYEWATQDPDWWAEDGITRENAEPFQKAIDATIAGLLVIGVMQTRRETIPDDLQGMNAADLLALDLPDAQWRVQGLLPEGLVLIAAPPKTGKSVFCYQLGVELALAGSVLDINVPQCDVLYYALEDGQRRSQQRVGSMLQGRKNGIERLQLRWTSPHLGGALENEVDAWLQEHPRGLVMIDVLAKVRPQGGGRSLNAYDVDYEALTKLHYVVKTNPGSTILVVTHDRKAGSEDWITRVTGTRGVTGAADAVIFIDRKRGSEGGHILVTGRDTEDASFDVRFDVTGWRLADVKLLIGASSPTRQTIYNWLEENGPAWPDAIATGTGLGADSVRHRVRDMIEDGQLITLADRLGYRVPGETIEGDAS